MKTLLRIDSSPRKTESLSRQLADVLQQKLENEGNYSTLSRDVYYDDLVKLGNEDSVTAYFTPDNQRTVIQKEAVKASDVLSQEFANADAYIFAVPMYNFGVTAGLKAYIDLIARAGTSFKYTEKGPEGLLKGKKAFVIITTGGTKLGTEVDYVSGYLKTFLNFVGITDIEFINSDQVMTNAEKILSDAKEEINQLVLN
ncbi:NAD(P)H-dependent oxidoreductase [Aquimarina gracilis]|uniref:FMN dependent NADH:quinone oxidoreductase n=1 Tax=Aquimarina gracilis TaxID=874422 RepID=A0ABU5ZXY0_9FLAO|nr:NAD(P)H-dependent oxidoreductase [Aquimarina gracilis]MEB3346729.1 NAD(P)H-dependent oxidoreductase [Aquimarina gracilis]